MWKDVEGYEGLYQVSEDGQVKSKRGLLSPYINQNRNKGYLRVGLCKNGKVTQHLVHRLVALAFIDNEENLPFVNHKNEKTFDNRYTNLEWCTSQENAEHSLSKEYIFISPAGVVEKVFNLTKFCRDNNLTQALMWKVHKGERNQHKGWKAFNEFA